MSSVRSVVGSLLFPSAFSLALFAGCSSDSDSAQLAGGGTGASDVGGRSGAGTSGAGSDAIGEGGAAGGAAGSDESSAGEAGAAGGNDSEPSIVGNIDGDELPDHGSVAFLLIHDKYRLFKKEGAEDTSISFVADDGKFAYGWYRLKPIDDPGSVDTAFALDLSSGEFKDMLFDDSRASIVRGGNGRKLVGKMILMNKTPDTKSDDRRLGFIYDLDSHKLQLIGREGHSDTGFTAINSSGVITGFNDFGEIGFVYEGGAFHELTAPNAYRLFPFAITSDKTIVGAWGDTADDWFDELRGSGFVARATPGGSYDGQKYVLAGYSAMYLTGLNDAGAFCGTAHATDTSYRVLVRGSALGKAPEVVPFTANYEPFATGIDERGWIFGQAMAVVEKKDCAGHGRLMGAACACDSGYQLDAYDMTNCIALGAVCNGHGHEHEVGVCHCDSGFKNPVGDKSHCTPS